METLWNVYQLRLKELNDTFIRLLSEFQDSHLFTNAELSKYRVEYLGEIIEKTIKNDQEKMIRKLSKQIEQLKSDNQKLHSMCNQLGRNQLANCAEYQFKQKSLGSTKVSTNYVKRIEQDQSSDSFLEIIPQKNGRKIEKTNKPTLSTQKNHKQKQKIVKNGKNMYRLTPQDVPHDDQFSCINLNFKYLQI